MTDSGDLARIDRAAAGVEGVREAVTVIDRRLRAHNGPDEGPVTARPPGTPIAGGRPALVRGPEPGVPSEAPRTLGEALLQAAASAPGRGLTYVLPDGGTDRQTYPELVDEALRALTGLRALGLAPGDSVLMQCADSRTFVTGFWACVLGGFVPTPVGAAPDYGTENAVVRKLRAAWELLDHPVVLTDTELHDRVAGLAPLWKAEGQLRVVSLAESASAAEPAEPFAATPDHPVVNLLTSGSTGTPKCVRHVHRTIVARTHAAIAANGFTQDDVSLNWMPLDHVGGMVMCNVRDVFLRCEHVNAGTESVIRRPLNWLDWIHRFRATTTWAPNFAFALVLKHREEIAAGRWDLSSMRNICNAGEAVVARTAFAFVEALAPHGLPADAMVPCWGMSETSSGVTYGRLDIRDPSVGTVTLDSGSLDGQLVRTVPDTPGAVTVTEVGRPVPGVALRITDDEGRVLPEGRVGRLHVTGTTVMEGYLRNKAANAASFTDDGWFDTGDLGFVRDGRLTLTGRRQNMVIVNGANFPSHEIEAVIEQAEGVRPACAAVCGLPDEDTGTEAVYAFFVPTPAASADLDRTVLGIRTALTRTLALRPKAIVPVSEEEFPRAAGGKIQRKQLVDALRQGRFDHRMYGGEPVRAEQGGSRMLESTWSPVDVLATGPGDRPTVVYASDTADWAWRVPGVTGVVTPGERFRVGEDGHVVADLADPEQQDRALAHLLAVSGPPERVVYAVESGVTDDAPEAPERFLVTLAALARAVPGADLVVLTRGALHVREGDEVVPGRAALTGMVRTAATEGVCASVRLVDAPLDADGKALAQLADTGYGADVVGVRDGAGHAYGLRVVEPAEDLDVPGEFLRPGGTALVTGGLGGLGRAVCEHLLVAVGARLLVVGRTPETELDRTGAGEVLAGLRDLGEVRYAAVDVADAAALTAAVAAAERDWGQRLGLVVHLAGSPIAPQWDDLAAHHLTRESLTWLRHMMRPKARGCAAVEELLEDRPDTAVVLFSSVNGFLGGSGFGAYAAANAAVDGYARRWAARGRRVRCLAWSMWAGPGMNEGNPLTAAARRRGLGLIDPAEGVSSLLRALHHRGPHLLIGADPANPHMRLHLASDQFAGGSVVVAVLPEPEADVDAVRREVAAALAREGVFAQITVVPRLPRDVLGAVDPVAVLASRETAHVVHAAPQGPGEILVADVLGELLGADRIGRDVSFFSLGCDSIRAVQAADRLGARFGREVPVELLYAHPTVRDLADALDLPDSS
ncbi:SDR family NAD(P)-dependent oxidoreductase [Streptomyces olivaceus]